MMLDKNKKFLIVGLGLIGGSYASGLSKKGYEVGALTLNQEDIDFALEQKYIASGSVEVNKDYVSNFDIIIFALYPHDFINWIKNYQSYFKSGALITDVTGVKGGVVNEVQNILRKDVEFIAAHPMAGREVSGVKNANPDIFKGANYIVVPTLKNSETAISICEQIGETLEFKNIVTLNCDEHDEMIGFLSQLTHCIAISLMTCKYDAVKLAKYTGDSFKDLTRIAKINENMWCELFLLNKEKLLHEMDLFLKQFMTLKAAIENNDEDKIKEIMKDSTQNRLQFDKGGNE